MSWMNNPVMEWSTNGTTWYKITDHGRSPLSISWERIEKKQRMAGGTLRRYVVAKKRTFSCSWENLPSEPTTFLAGGDSYGRWLENWHNTNDSSFYMRLRAGSDSGKTNPNSVGSTILNVMISDFSKEIVKRGRTYDLWSLDITLEEV